MATARTCANHLHLAPVRSPCHQPIIQFYRLDAVYQTNSIKVLKELTSFKSSCSLMIANSQVAGK